MRRTVQTGSMIDRDILLALYRYSFNATDSELDGLGVTRGDVTSLIHFMEVDNEGYRDNELRTIAENCLRIYAAGRKSGRS